MSGIRSITRGPTVKGYASATSAPIRVDSNDNNILKVNTQGSGTTEYEIVSQLTTTITGDGAVPLVPGKTILTKGSAAAITVAAPGTGMIGREITIISGSDFAHVITFTGGTLWDGTTGVNTTVTMTAFRGSAITFIGLTALVWGVESQNNLTSIA
jgi:hypothetical protein